MRSTSRELVNQDWTYSHQFLLTLGTEGFSKPKDLEVVHPQEAFTKILVAAREILSLTQPHKALSQPVIHDPTLSEKPQEAEKWVAFGKGMIFVKGLYVRRLELENLVYRQHLHTLERGIYSDAFESIADVLGLEHIPEESPSNGVTGTVPRGYSLKHLTKSEQLSNTSAVERINRVLNQASSSTQRKTTSKVKQGITSRSNTSGNAKGSARISDKQTPGKKARQGLKDHSSTTASKKRKIETQRSVPVSNKKQKGNQFIEDGKKQHRAPKDKAHGIDTVRTSSEVTASKGNVPGAQCIIDLTKDAA